MTRAELLTYLTYEFATLGTELAITFADSNAGIDTVLDAAMDALGSDTNDANARALGDYFFLRFAWRRASVRVDFDTTGIRANRSQLAQQIKDLVEDAQQRCEALGLAVGDAALVIPAPLWVTPDTAYAWEKVTA